MTKRSTVPRGTSDPIGWLLDNGWSRIDLAVEWEFKTTDTIYRLQRAEYNPPPLTAQRMAKTFGWKAGEVVDHWLSLTERKAATR